MIKLTDHEKQLYFQYKTELEKRYREKLTQKEKINLAKMVIKSEKLWKFIQEDAKNPETIAIIDAMAKI